VYRCTPTQLAEIPIDTLLDHLAIIDTESTVRKYNSKLTPSPAPRPRRRR
jgi:hypothetical protein